MRCERHPNVETELACGKCGRPICPSCVVPTPVGARCRDCAGMKRLPVYSVSKFFYVRAILAGLIGGAILGAVWPFIPLSGFLTIILAIGIGYAVGEAVSYSVNRKRGPGLQVIAAVGVAVSYIIRSFLLLPDFTILAAFVSVYGLIALALGIVVATSRVR